jgi:SAM-dependent methyltransferase
MSTFSIRNILTPYNPGSYILKPENAIVSFFRRFIEYLCGVTIARSSINRIKPAFIFSMHGDILEIGGFDNFFKPIYKQGKFLNLDIKPGEFIDIVENAEDMKSINDAEFSSVICSSVLEHTHHPEKIINEIHRILKPGGFALITTPWMFESHMEPFDYYRFSNSFYEFSTTTFTTQSIDTTNGYFGVIAHFCQHNIILRISIGGIFLLLDNIFPNKARWSTQTTVILKKPK